MLRLLRERQGTDERLSVILAWTLDALAVDGAALMQAFAEKGSGVRVVAARGSLSAHAQAVAEALSHTGLPRSQGAMAMPSSVVPTDILYCFPVGSSRGAVVYALVLQGPDAAGLPQRAAEELRFVLPLLQETIESIPAGAGTLSGAQPRSDEAAVARLPPGLDLLTEGLRLPAYVCDRHGKLQYVSPAFLELTGDASLEELLQRSDFFKDWLMRADEIETIRAAGKVTAFPLTVISRLGSRVEILDSAVLIGESIVGVAFNVTALVEANAELKDFLQIQELLNDSIIAGATTLQRTQGAAIRTLARLAEYRDPETGFHLQRICEYTRILALQVHERAPYSFHIPKEYGDDIALSSMLHDIGKVSIPDSILLKPGKLDPTEWEMMKKHTVFGWEVLHKADLELGEQSFLTLAATIALSHHERFDGTGYPNRTVGEQIPLSARISALADVYDALTSERPYKEAWTHEQAMEEIQRSSGSHFDPVLVEIFRDVNGVFADVRRRFPG
jgi:response regulator RpfG family c-di-GMP phosphodiesterase